jgi:hypothetical protein
VSFPDKNPSLRNEVFVFCPPALLAMETDLSKMINGNVLTGQLPYFVVPSKK